MKRRELVRAALASGLMTPIAMGRRVPSGRVPSAEPSDWRVNGDRVNGWLRELSRFGANPEGGVSRTGFSDADVEGRAWLREVMRAAGLEVRVDPAGNLIGARPGSEPGAKPLLFGSHIDSVPHGGNYDGDVGSLGAVEVALTLRERGYRNRHPLWVAVWCDEERGLTGSRGFLGNVTKEELARPYVDGMTLGECIRKIGGDPDAMAGYRHEAGGVAGYVELHIEQGGILDRAGIRIGVVEGIVTIRSSNVTVKGVANHAGTTPMPERKNALLAASELALAVDRIVKGHPGRQVGTVGRFEVKPGASNVIPGEVSMSIELRDLSVDTLNQLWDAIAAEGDRIMARRGTSWDKTWRPANPPAVADPTVRSAITEAAKGIGLTTHSMPSGAGHDAQNLARVGPMGMIFVPSVGGISHAPQEYTKPEDVTNGVNALLQTILALDAA